jgi:hypothetical protein
MWLLMSDNCTRCGLCCHYLKNGVLVRCKHLRGSIGDTTCVIYATRLFRKIDVNCLCFPRNVSKLDYPDCPNNTNKPILEVYSRLKHV